MLKTLTSLKNKEIETVYNLIKIVDQEILFDFIQNSRVIPINQSKKIVKKKYVKYVIKNCLKIS